MSKKRKRILWLSLIMGVVLSLLMLFILLGGVEKIRRRFKEPSSYTWEEYQAMDPEQKDELYERFDSAEDFEAWMESVQPKETEPVFVWDEPGKTPDAYTYEEYQALTAEKKEAFYQWFGSLEEFESWLNKAKGEVPTTQPPTWDEQEKRPNEYTWAEYQTMTPEEQDAFYLWFDSKEAFEAWMNAAQPAEVDPEKPTWDLSGKTPDAYTWEEYQALSPEQQDAFYLWFGSLEAFEVWMENAKPDEERQPEIWDKPGKQPNEYTWEEYQSLTPEEQDLFFLWFDSIDAFEAWMNQAQGE